MGRSLSPYKDGVRYPADGLITAIEAREETHTTRLALLYALLDSSPLISVTHIEAAIAAWKYCSQSARYLFPEKESTEIPHKQKILNLLRLHPEGRTTTEITGFAFKFNQIHGGGSTTDHLTGLENMGLIKSAKVQGAGRSTFKWRSVTK